LDKKIYFGIYRALKIGQPTTQNLVVQCLPAEIAILKKVKQHRGWILLGWEAACERRVLLEFLHLLKGKIVFFIHFSQVGRAVQGVRLKI
jgi:hypothetical protein